MFLGEFFEFRGFRIYLDLFDSLFLVMFFWGED